MPDANELVKALKKAAVEAVDASKPVNVFFGVVVSASPLKINVEQKMVLGEAQLILARNVTDFKTSATVSWATETASSHKHDVSGKKEITIHNGLANGDKVILIRQQEGQKYIVLDRMA